METIYLRIHVSESDTFTDDIRNQGLFFEYIAEAIGVDRESVEEIDDTNCLPTIDQIKEKFSK